MSSSSVDPPEKTLIDQRINTIYKIRRKIGGGSFGETYLGNSIVNGEQVAIKVEPIRAPLPLLEYESRVYKCLAGGVGVPCIRWFGQEMDNRFLVVDLLGPSLEDNFNICKRKFSMKTILMLADQLISRLEFLHSKHFLHRDIKPENFLMGLGEKDKIVHVIDFGFAKKFVDPKTRQHIPYRENKKVLGTARYSSINTHLGYEQSRRDDMEAVGYMLLYFCKGGLPWQGLKPQHKKDVILEKKKSIPLETLCAGLPTEFATYLGYCRGLGFEDKPDYGYMRKLFSDLMKNEGLTNDSAFDWIKVKKASVGPGIMKTASATPGAIRHSETLGSTVKAPPHLHISMAEGASSTPDLHKAIPTKTGSNIGHRSNIESLENNTSDNASMNGMINPNGSQGFGTESSNALSSPNNMGGSQSPLKNEFDPNMSSVFKSADMQQSTNGIEPDAAK